MRKIILLLLPAFLTGCAATWGGSYNVALANSRSVVIEYDPWLANVPLMLQEAQMLCSKYGKDAVFKSSTSGNPGIKVNTYRCETRIADKVIDVQN